MTLTIPSPNYNGRGRWGFTCGCGSMRIYAGLRVCGRGRGCWGGVSPETPNKGYPRGMDASSWATTPVRRTTWVEVSTVCRWLGRCAWEGICVFLPQDIGGSTPIPARPTPRGVRSVRATVPSTRWAVQRSLGAVWRAKEPFGSAVGSAPPEGSTSPATKIFGGCLEWRGASVAFFLRCWKPSPFRNGAVFGRQTCCWEVHWLNMLLRLWKAFCLVDQSSRFVLHTYFSKLFQCSLSSL